MKKIVLIALFVLSVIEINFAQEGVAKESPISFSASLQTNHLWRGLVITDKPMVGVITTLRLNKEGGAYSWILGRNGFF